MKVNKIESYLEGKYLSFVCVCEPYDIDYTTIQTSRVFLSHPDGQCLNIRITVYSSYRDVYYVY